MQRKMDSQKKKDGAIMTESKLNPDQREHYETLKIVMRVVDNLQKENADLAFENSCLKDEIKQMHMDAAGEHI